MANDDQTNLVKAKTDGEAATTLLDYIAATTVDIEDEAFVDNNVTAHIFLELPMSLLKELRKMALSDGYQGKYQTLIRHILLQHVYPTQPTRLSIWKRFWQRLFFGIRRRPTRD